MILCLLLIINSVVRIKLPGIFLCRFVNRLSKLVLTMFKHVVHIHIPHTHINRIWNIHTHPHTAIHTSGPSCQTRLIVKKLESLTWDLQYDIKL